MAKLKTIESTQNFSAIREIRRGIIATKDGRYIKLMEFQPINFSLRSASERASILRSFEAALRSMPETVQFKVISRSADPTSFIESLRKSMEKETNEKCRELQREQIALINSVAQIQGVSRRFFLAFPFEDEGVFTKTASFDDIYRSLENRASMIASALADCGNEQISIDDSNEYTMKALRSIMSRGESDFFTFEEREDAVEGRYAQLPGAKNWKIPVNDYLAPATIDTRMSPNFVQVDNLYYCYLYIPQTAYATRVFGGWMQLFVNMGEGIDVDFWFHKESPTTTQRLLQYKLRYNKIKARETEDTSTDFEELQSAIDSGYYIKQQLSAGDTFCYMSTVVTVVAPSINELHNKVNLVKNACLQRDFPLKQCTFKMGDMFNATLPICKYDKEVFRKSKRNIMLSALSSAYPLTSFEMSDENGVLIGTNINNDSLVFVDQFSEQYTNANMVLMGSSGAGKTYTLQCMALRLREKQTQVFIIAPLKGHEFERACDAIGGQFIRIVPGSGQNINIMEIRKKGGDDYSGNYTDEREFGESILSKKIASLHTFFSLLLHDITEEEKHFLDESLINTYGKFHITDKNKSLLDPSNPTRYRKMPVLGDLQAELKKFPEAKRLYNVLSRFVTGSAKSFNEQTNIDVNNKYVVFDVSKLTDEMRPIAMFIVLDLVQDKIQEDLTKKKIVFIDEAWKLVGTGSSRDAATFVLELFKTIRGYGGGVVAATQDLDDWFALDEGRFGKAIINNSRTKLIMGCEQRDAQAVAAEMELTQIEVDQIKSFNTMGRRGRGKCLLVANSNHVAIQVKASQKEHDLITTDPDDLRRLEKERKKAASQFASERSRRNAVSK